MRNSSGCAGFGSKKLYLRMKQVRRMEIYPKMRPLALVDVGVKAKI